MYQIRVLKMKSINLIALLLVCFSAQCWAETTDIFNKEVPLTYKERIAVSKAKEWIDGKNYPFRTGDKITYLYGQGQPVAVCAPLQLCIVEFGSDEKVSPNGIHLGDSARWQASPSVGEDNKTFLIIKPVDVGLSTSLVVVTNQASYNIRLISRRTDLTPRITFHNPNAVANEWVNYFDKKEADQKKRVAEADRKRAEAEQKNREHKAEIERKRQAYRLASAQKEKEQKAAEALRIKEQKAEAERKRQQYAAAKQKAELEARKSQMEIDQKKLEIKMAQQRLHDETKRQLELRTQRLVSDQEAARSRSNQAYGQVNKQSYSQRQQQQPDSKHELLALDFDYSISECPKCSWRPVRVYNNGKQTVIQMGASMSNTESPALLVLGSSGGEQLVNYRVKGDSYIVDQVFNAAVLVAGVGSKQNRVLVTRGRGIQ